jgi:hypothetical protein
MKLKILERAADIFIDVVTDGADNVKPAELGINFPYIIRPNIAPDGTTTHTAKQRLTQFKKSLKAKYKALKAANKATVFDLDS